MKKLFFLLALGAATPAWAQTSSSPTAPFQWRLRLQPGQKWGTTTDTSTLMTTLSPTAPGAPKTTAPATMKNTLTTHMVIDQRVLSSDTKGARIEMVYRDMSQKNKMVQGNQVIFDSAKPSAALKGMGDISKNLVGARLTYLLSPGGQISDIRGVETYLKRFDAAFDKQTQGRPQAAAMRKAFRGALSSALSADTIKAGLGISYSTMPKTAVRRGQSWKYTTTIPMMGLQLSQKGQSTFVSRSGGIVTLAEKIQFGTGAGSQFKLPGAPGAQNANLNFVGTSTGQVLVDEKTGLTLERRTRQNLSSKSSIPVGKNKTMPLHMELKAQTISKTQKLSAG